MVTKHAQAPAKPWYRMEAKGDTAEIVIYDQIGQSMWGDGYGSKKFNADLKALGNVKNINVRLNSPGGDVFEGQTIFNRLLAHKAHVTVYIDGLAASIASVIAMAGDKVVMAENALFMIHDPWSFAMGTAEDMRSTADVLDKVKDALLTAYTRKSDLPEDKISALMDAETWMTAKEALDMGFVDEIGVGQDIQNSFDLSKFKNAPKTPMQSGALRAGASTSGRVGVSNSTEGTMTKTDEQKTETTETATPATPEAIASAETPASTPDEPATETAPATPATQETPATEAQAATVTTVQASATPSASTEVQAERTRVLTIKANAFQGQEALVDKMIANGTSINDALPKLIADFKARPTTTNAGPSPIEQLRAAAPKPAGWVEASTTGSKLPFEEQVKADWDADQAIRDKYNGDFARYTSYREKTKNLK